MFDTILNSIGWTGIAVALVILFLILELTMRALTNRYTARADRYPHRAGSQLPRAHG